ncbi:HlyD family type I secretion periplasmic adaptor subunit [Pseudomonas cichorii]|uniref:HlyD family type I secretion periplasmic adaptor subunit n=1 Tax=Pseudomonas lijiangensis TaxID=2995658 RepID=UPI001C8740FD|nr:HlyD family type I secretion periplasmic adaptor subunit [Pseudomonas cichorii]MBX8533652.1 HlyD family type I secretion periplasmic adaptor subunit [Pseudomonas cichorii]MBX8553687.1 HlyD family type I secretion periplasmic adaptor subunit [Pseudomonas cichorii]
MSVTYGLRRRFRPELAFLNERNSALLQDSSDAQRLTVWVATALILTALIWAHYAVLQEVTTGEGKAIPSSKVQVIQNLEGGIVTEIFVREGQVVNKGDTLLRLDDTRFLSNRGESEVDRLTLTAQVERLAAEAEGRPLLLPQELLDKAPQVAADERALYESRQRRLDGEQRTLNEQLRQKTQELAEFRSRQEQFRNSLALVQQELDMSIPLVGSGAVSPVEILRLKRNAVEMRGSMNANTLAIPRAEAAINETRSRIQESELTFRSEASRELNEKRADLAKISANRIAIDDRMTRTTVTSPVRGIVKTLKINTIGGVVQPGSDLLEIVPLEDNLLIEARVRPQDVAFLHPGQKAMVKFSAYDYTIYGGLPARLEMIGADTVTDDKGNSFYLIQVRTDRNHLGGEDRPLLIIPGMVATVDIITGEKSVMDYLLKPVLKGGSEALRER